MPRKKTTDFDEYKYQQEYIKTNLKFVNVPFNSKFPDEIKLYDYLNDHYKETGEKKGAYIKRLIREDMERSPLPVKKNDIAPEKLYTPYVIPFLYDDDITFCPDDKCKVTSCMRNPANIRDRSIPHSYFKEIPSDCPSRYE